MAFASVGSLGTGALTTAGTSATITTGAAAEAGNLVVLIVTSTNRDGTGDGASAEVTGITDSAGGNTWYRQEGRNGEGVISAGAVCSVWWSALNKTIANGGTITALFSQRWAVAMTAWEFTKTAANVVQLAGSVQRLANDSADPGSQSISGLDSAEYLFVRGISTLDNASTALTPTASYTGFTTVVADTSEVGHTFEDIGARGEFRILTGTGDTSDPTSFSGIHASVYLALKEASDTFVPSVMVI